VRRRKKFQKANVFFKIFPRRGRGDSGGGNGETLITFGPETTMEIQGGGRVIVQKEHQKKKKVKALGAAVSDGSALRKERLVS